MKYHIDALLGQCKVEPNKLSRTEFSLEEKPGCVLIRYGDFVQSFDLFDKDADFVYNTYVNLCVHTGDLILSASITKLVLMSKSETAFVVEHRFCRSAIKQLQNLCVDFCVVTKLENICFLPKIETVFSFGRAETGLNEKAEIKELYIFKNIEEATRRASDCCKTILFIE